jgi:putative SOS response-associated peptidase YedK
LPRHVLQGRRIRKKGRQAAGPLASVASGKTGRLIRTFAVITTDANALVGDIHDRMSLILAPEDFGRWLGDEPNPADLMRPFPTDRMRMWPISTRVNKPENDDPSILEAVELATNAA